MAKIGEPLLNGTGIIDLTTLGLDELRRLTGDDFEQLKRTILTEIGSRPLAFCGYSEGIAGKYQRDLVEYEEGRP